jgi:hypothetical protein
MAGLIRHQNEYGIRSNLRCGVSILQREGRLGRDIRKLHGISSRLDFEQDWTDHRPISRSSVKPRKTGDYIINESWQEPGGAGISCTGSG